MRVKNKKKCRDKRDGFLEDILTGNFSVGNQESMIEEIEM
jgi:hypothetical protein